MEVPWALCSTQRETNNYTHARSVPQGLSLPTPSVSCVDGEWEVSVPTDIIGSQSKLGESRFGSREGIFDKKRDATPLAEVYESYVRGVLNEADKDEDGV